MAHCNDNPCFILTCCGCLPFVSLIKSAINCIPLAVVFSIPCTLIALIMFIPCILMTEYTIYKTKKLGPNIKTLLLAVTWIPMLLYPVVVLFASLLFGFGYAIYKAFDTSFGQTSEHCYYWYLGGVVEAYPEILAYVGDFWKENYDGIFTKLKGYRDYQLQPNEQPFDITLMQSLVGLWTAAIGAIVDGLLVFVIATIKLVPFLLRCYQLLWSYYCCSDTCGDCGSCDDFVCKGMCFPVWILANVLCAPAVLSGYCIVLVGGFIVGLGAARVSYNHNFEAAVYWMFEQARSFDEVTSEFISNDKSSCSFICCFKNQPSGLSSTAANNPHAGVVVAGINV